MSGPFSRVDDDPFDLDRDGNGIACEDSEGGGGGGGGGDNGSTPTGGVDSGYGPMARRVSGEEADGSWSLPLGLGGAFFAVTGTGLFILARRTRA